MNEIAATTPLATTRDSQRALRLVVLLGVVSLFADMTYEGARSIAGPFLAVLGASGTVVGLVSGLGELAGYGLRLWSGRLADRTHRYWTITIVGYAVNLLAVPLLALAGHWSAAAALMVLERVGKAIRTPAVQERLMGTFTDARDRFFAGSLTEAQGELNAVIGSTPAGTGLRRRAIDAAIEITRRCIERWRREQEPGAEALFREGFGRFVELVDQFRQRLHAIPELAEVTDDLVALGFTGPSGFHYTEILTVAPASAGSQALDQLRTRASRVRAVERDAFAYLARLLEVNSTRLKNDFLQRLGDSRGQLERALRIRLQGLTGSARQALEQARTAHTEGAEAVDSKVRTLQRLRSDVDRLGSPGRLMWHQPGRIGAPVTGDGGNAPPHAGQDRLVG